MNKIEHLLTCLSEECAELQQAVSKALRFGLEDGHPEKATTNEDDIKKELTDIMAVVEMLELEGILRFRATDSDVVEKANKVKKYMDYARKRGTLV